VTSSLFGVDLEVKRASQKALKENKLILFTVESENCSYCRKMEKDVFSVKRIMNKIEKQYVRVKIVAGREAIPSYLDVEYFPTNFILKPKTLEIIDEYPGYMRPKDFLEILDIIYEQEFKK
jgi:thioredoxin-related protein